MHREAFLLKTALLFEPGVVVTDVPLVPGEPRRGPDNRPLEPARSVVLIPVSAVHDPTVRAVVYAKSLRPTMIEAIYLATDPEETPGVIEALVRPADRRAARCWSKRRSAISAPRCSRRCTSTPNAATRS